jgi:hypothetical protein
MSWRRLAVTIAGPLVIIAVVLFALRGFVFHDLLTNEHPDLLSFWLPRWTFLGRAMAAGHVPSWNPFEMTGYRFAADPQSGWLYLPPSLLFALVSPDVAMRAMIVLHPLLAGLGLYAFLRVDGLGRVAATAGGLSLAAAIASSEIAISMPFAGAVSWSVVALLGAAGFRRSARWSSRLSWIALAAFAWSQVASAHLSHGLVVGSTLLVAYLVSNAIVAWRRREATGSALAARTLLFLAILPLASLAILLPRLAFLDASSLGRGYDRLGGEIAATGSAPGTQLEPGGVWAGWPFAAATAPGAYAGATILLAVPAALRARRRRALVGAFGVVLAGTYLLLSNAVLAAGWIRSTLLALPYGDVLLHNPGRLRYVALLALPVLGAAGIQGLLEDPPGDRRSTLVWLGAGLVLWLIVPLAFRAYPARWLLFAAAVAPATVAFALATRRRDGWRVTVVAVLALELLVGAVWAGRWSGDELRIGLDAGSVPLVLQPLRAPDVDAPTFLAKTTLVDRIGGDRYLTWVPPYVAYEKGYLFAQDPWDWPMLANERGTLFGLQDVLGYNPVQLPRYWSFIRQGNDLPITYNTSVLQRPTERDLSLLGVRYLIVPQDVPPPVTGRVIASADGYDLVRVAEAQPLVSAPTRVRLATDAEEALRRARSPRLDPVSAVVLEHDPGIGEGGRTGDLTWTWPDAEHLQIHARLPSDAVLLVRFAWDAGWTATIDGTVAGVSAADGFLLGVPVPAGEHDVVLTYRDADVARGLWGSAVVWAMLGIAFVAAAGIEWRAAREGSGEAER